jgi:hypothetical protein
VVYVRCPRLISRSLQGGELTLCCRSHKTLKANGKHFLIFLRGLFYFIRKAHLIGQ